MTSLSTGLSYEVSELGLLQTKQIPQSKLYVEYTRILYKYTH